MLLEGKTALVFAANGEVSSAVAQAFAREGADVFLSSRDTVRLEVTRAAVTNEARGGSIEADVVDATDPEAVEMYVADVAKRSGHIDVVFNGIAVQPEEGSYCIPAAEVPFEKFVHAIEVVCGSQFLTARAAAGHAAEAGGGSIILFTASLSGQGVPMMASLTAACGAIEAMGRSLASEYAPMGVRVNTLRADGMPATAIIQKTTQIMMANLGAEPGPPQSNDEPVENVMGRHLTVDDTAAVAVYLASDLSAAISSQVIDVTAGELRV